MVLGVVFLSSLATATVLKLVLSTVDVSSFLFVRVVLWVAFRVVPNGAILVVQGVVIFTSLAVIGAVDISSFLFVRVALWVALRIFLAMVLVVPPNGAILM